MTIAAPMGPLRALQRRKILKSPTDHQSHIVNHQPIKNH